MSVITVTSENFEEIKKSDKKVLLDFFATWCGPCKMVSPLVDEIAEEHPEYIVGKVDVDEEGAIAEMMANPAKNAQKIEQLLMKGSKDSPKLKPFYNKILSIRKPATKLGKFFPKMAKLGMRGLTFGGGLFNSLFVAFFLGDAVKSTIDAPKEKKTGIRPACFFY